MYFRASYPSGVWLFYSFSGRFSSYLNSSGAKCIFLSSLALLRVGFYLRHRA
jgi:hypothetical protein